MADQKLLRQIARHLRTNGVNVTAKNNGSLVVRHIDADLDGTRNDEFLAEYTSPDNATARHFNVTFSCYFNRTECISGETTRWVHELFLNVNPA